MVKTTKRKSNIKRPVRQKKSDVMIHGRTSVAAKMCDVHLARLQRAVDDMDKKWGIDRWMELASASMADKWQGAYNKMMEFVDKEDVEKVSTWVDGCIRGLGAINDEIEASGAPTACQDVWEVKIDDVVYGVMKDGRSWQSIKDQRPDLELVTMREVACALKMWRGSVAGEFERAAKAAFPKAEVTAIDMTQIEDEIEF